MNYASLILAGVGTIGRGVLAVGGPALSAFDQVVLVDQDADALNRAAGSPHAAVQGDITDPAFLERLVRDAARPALFVNLCAGIDSVSIRRLLAPHPVAYLDICASERPGEGSGRLSDVMPYTNSAQHRAFPHLLCQGINPGMVEFIARRLIDEMRKTDDAFAVTVFEHDSLDATTPDGRRAVGWSPAGLVEESVLVPTLEVVEGARIEGKKPGSRPAVVRWDGEERRANVVAHEDIWNLADVPGVREARFYYSLRDDVMDLLGGDPKSATAALAVAPAGIPLAGADTVVVRVRGLKTGATRCLQWTTNHADVGRRHGVNAVQFQTATSVLCSVLLMRHTPFWDQPMTCNASTAPMTPDAWQEFERIQAGLGIEWTACDPQRVTDPPAAR